MKYLINPLLLCIKFIIQVIIAILITIVWLIPTIIVIILYPILNFLWNFKLKFYKLMDGYQHYDRDGITNSLLWVVKYKENSYTEMIKYKTYFHRIWNLNKDSNPKLYNLINKLR